MTGPVPCLAMPDLAAAYVDILTGRRRLFGWGAVANFRFHQWRCPWPLSGVIDADLAKRGLDVAGVPILPPDALAEHAANPDDVIIMVFPESPSAVAAITAALAERGFHHVIPPFRVESDRPALRLALEALTARGQPVPTWAATLLADPFASDGWSAPVCAGVPGRITLASEQLILGGSERQICYLATGVAALGHDTDLISLGPPHPGIGQMEERLLQAGVPHHRLPLPRLSWRDPVVVDGEDATAVADLLRRLPVALIHPTLEVRRHLSRRRPTAVIAYMERMGVIAALAGMMAGVPRILISLRSLDPRHFSQYFPEGTDWFRDTLAWLASRPEVRLCANSGAGAAACADWLGLSAGAVPVVRNAAPDAADRARAVSCAASLRMELGLPPEARVIAGVFRLVPEKRPFLFLDVVRSLLPRHPDLHVVVVGDGPLRSDLAAAAQASDLGGRVRFIGPRPDAAAVIALADLLLHTAAFEGMPNVHLEAQALGRPVVCLDVGGTKECLAPALHACALDPQGSPGDLVERLAGLCDRLLRDDVLRATLGEAGRAMADQAASPLALARDTLALCGVA